MAVFFWSGENFAWPESSFIQWEWPGHLPNCASRAPWASVTWVTTGPGWNHGLVHCQSTNHSMANLHLENHFSWRKARWQDGEKETSEKKDGEAERKHRRVAMTSKQGNKTQTEAGGTGVVRAVTASLLCLAATATEVWWTERLLSSAYRSLFYSVQWAPTYACLPCLYWNLSPSVSLQ